MTPVNMAYFYVYNAHSKVRVVVFFSALWVGQGVGFSAPLVSWVLCTAPCRQGAFVQFMLSG